MSRRARAYRVGIAAILCALAVRLGTWQLPGLVVTPEPKVNIQEPSPEQKTGQSVRSFAASVVYAPESAAPWLLPAPLPHFTQVPALLNETHTQVDAQALLEEPLTWDLREGTTVLILSTHATECYTREGESFPYSSQWRTLEPEYNMLSIGDRVESILEAAGIGVIRDRELHDHPSYNGSYGRARESIQSILAQNSGILLVLDLHRDAADTAGGGQLRTLCLREGESCAQIMPVMGLNNSSWQQNLSLALKLSAQLELTTPGITRPIILRSAQFNQDLCPGALLLEIGAAGNTHAEALRAAEALAQAIIALAEGTQ